MGDNDDADDAFAYRLAALKAPPIANPQNDDELAARFQQLFARSPGGSVPGPPKRSRNSEDDAEVRQLVNAVREEKETWTVDESEIEALLEEVGGLMGGQEEEEEEAPHWLGDERGDIEEEEDIMKRVREEVEWEARHGVKDEEEEEREGGEAVEDPADEDEDLSELQKRFQALGGIGAVGGGGGDGGGLELPAVPKIVPGVPVRVAPKKGVGVSEIDTWCCICSEDAEYRCSGCDNDIYCKDCLYEAHVGPSAGYEERRHKWTKYVRPKNILSAA